MENKTILLVEDNPDDIELTLRALSKNNIMNEVVLARDGKEAMDFLLGTGSYTGRDIRKQPVVVLLDLKLPKLNGLDVLARLRADERTQLIPVVVLTSSKEEEDMIASYESGANSYIRKPIDFNQFMETIRELGMYWLVLNPPPPRTRKGK
jgi:two-component system, response regulator